MSEITEVLHSVVEQVLETMFFSTVLSTGAEPDAGPHVTADVSFAGSASGSLSVWVSQATAQALTASFLGVMEEEIPPGQMQASLGELANVICGAVLGRVSPAGRFVISPPNISSERPAGSAVQAFELPEGVLSVGLSMGDVQ